MEKMGAAGYCRSMRQNQTKKSSAMFREMRMGERPQTKNRSVMFIRSAPEKWEKAAIKRKKNAKLRCGSRGGKTQNFAKDERGDSIGVPPGSGAEKSQKTVTEKSADAA